MNACYVLLEFPVLSETFISDEVAALREVGASVLTVSLQGGPGADIALDRHWARSGWVLGRAARILLRRPAALRALVSGPLSPGLRLKLLAAAEEARRRGVDVVHAHFAYRSADGAEVVGRALGTGHSVTTHAHDIFVETAELSRRLAAARLVVTVCEYNRRHLEQHYGLEVGGKLHVVPCSTDPRPPECPEAPARPRPRILAVGRLVPKKGFDDLLRARARMRADADIVLAGDGPLRGDLERLATELGIDHRVSFLGAQDHHATKCLYRSADLFCLPCRVAPDGDRDSMPVVIKEAMAAGLAVVSTREVGVPEMVVDGDTGLLVPPDDPAALAHALDELLEDDDRRAAMGAAGRTVVAQRFDLRDQARRLIELFG